MGRWDFQEGPQSGESQEGELLSGASMPTDEQLRLRVRDAIAWDDSLRDTRISVGVVNTTVYLDGEVSTEEQKQAASQHASRVFGVGRVVNELMVQPRTC